MRDVSLDEIAATLLGSKKYRKIDLAAETVHAVVSEEVSRHRHLEKAIEQARRKLHHVAAAYLGDPDYEAAEIEFGAVADGDVKRLRDVILKIAAAHATTRERLAVVDEYYERIFAVTGRPRVVLDLACGLNPLLLAWMNLPHGAQYHAYDVRRRRVEFLNRFLQMVRLPPLAKLQDVLVRRPLEHGDVALLLQEAHRIEQRRSGASRTLLEGISARHVVLSLPIRSLGSRHSLARAHRSLFQRIVRGTSWPVQELEIGNELVFCIDKGPGAAPAASAG